MKKPATCQGCPLCREGEGFAPPEGEPKLGVALLGEALGEQEVLKSRPFVGPAGFRLERMLQRAGYQRNDFQILNTVSCRPPKNRQPWPNEIDSCRQYWEPEVRKDCARVVVPMGNVGLGATLGLDGILSKRGYVWKSKELDAFVLPTVHPSYIMRGNSNWEAAFIYDIRHAVEIAREGWEPIERQYVLDPPPAEAWNWAFGFERELLVHPKCALSADIETPDKSDSEDQTDINLGYLAGTIYRIGFAYVDRHGKTQVLSVPWDANYLPVIKRLFKVAKELIFAYRHFDVPRIRAHGVEIVGEVLDVQEAWHVLHSDLPKSLEHITPYLCPRQPAWKHLSGSEPAFYNAIDAGVQIEGWWRLRTLLEQAGLLGCYERDVRKLNPILIYMGQQGMPISPSKRLEASELLMQLKEANRGKLNQAAEGARPQKIYKRKPKDDGTYIEVPLEVEEQFCTECGRKANAKHPHFKSGEAPGEVPLGEVATRMVALCGYAKALDFKPSNPGLIRYAQFKGYRLISRWDRTEGKRVTSMDENSVRKYALKYPEDPVWPLVLEERELTKLLGTYVGRITEEPEKPKSKEQEWHEARLKATYGKMEDGSFRKGNTFNPWGNVTSSNIQDDDIPF